jgi:hypothetical protein
VFISWPKCGKSILRMRALGFKWYCRCATICVVLESRTGEPSLSLRALPTVESTWDSDEQIRAAIFANWGGRSLHPFCSRRAAWRALGGREAPTEAGITHVVSVSWNVCPTSPLRDTTPNPSGTNSVCRVWCLLSKHIPLFVELKPFWSLADEEKQV